MPISMKKYTDELITMILNKYMGWFRKLNPEEAKPVSPKKDEKEAQSPNKDEGIDQNHQSPQKKNEEDEKQQEGEDEILDPEQRRFLIAVQKEWLTTFFSLLGSGKEVVNKLLHDFSKARE